MTPPPIQPRATSVEDMWQLAAKWALALASIGRASGTVLALSGPLGAGKTQFIRGLVRGLGGDEREVASPTFGLVREYGDCHPPVAHWDWYRLQHPDMLLETGWDEMLGSDRLIAVEWAERFPEQLPPGTLWLRIDPADATATPGEPARRLELRDELPGYGSDG